MQMTAALITLTKKSVAHLCNTSRKIRLDNCLTFRSVWLSHVCNTADVNRFEIMLKWLVPSTYQTQCTEAVSRTALIQMNTLHRTLSVKLCANTSADLWVWPINFCGLSHKRNPDAAQHNMEKWPERDEYTFSRRNTLSAGGLGARFNMANSHQLLSFPLKAADSCQIGREKTPEHFSKRKLVVKNA